MTFEQNRISGPLKWLPKSNSTLLNSDDFQSTTEHKQILARLFYGENFVPISHAWIIKNHRSDSLLYGILKPAASSKFDFFWLMGRNRQLWRLVYDIFVSSSSPLCQCLKSKYQLEYRGRDMVQHSPRNAKRDEREEEDFLVHFSLPFHCWRYFLFVLY